MAENRYPAVIAGGGIAGLTAAAYLSREGQKVLLVEKNTECGGLVNSFERDGYHFDTGVRALEDAGIIFPMLDDLGIHLEVVKSPVSLGIENEIMPVENLESLKRYRSLLAGFYPESEAEIDAVLRIVRKIMKHMDVLYGIENPVFKDLKQDKHFLFKSLLPWLPKFVFTVGKINRLSMPVEDYLAALVKNPSLRDILSQHFFRNTPVFFALSYFSLYLDYFYPKGGVGNLSGALREKILEWGGDIRTGTEITAVSPDKQMVKDRNRRVYAYDHLIWAADLKSFYSMTETDGLPRAIRKRFGNAKKRMLNHRGGDSVFTLFLEVDEPPSSFRKISSGHFFYTPSRRGLGETHRKELESLLDRWDRVDRRSVLTWLDRFTELNTYEISIPVLKDPALAPPGKTGLIISLLAEYDLFRKARETGWYDELKAELENRILTVMAHSIYPMLKDKVRRRFSLTPLSIESRVGSSEGAITGWAFQQPVPVIDKIQHSARAVLTPIPGIFQAGQWAYSPGGVPMAILTGKLAADRVLKSTGKGNRNR